MGLTQQAVKWRKMSHKGTLPGKFFRVPPGPLSCRQASFAGKKEGFLLSIENYYKGACTYNPLTQKLHSNYEREERSLLVQNLVAERKAYLNLSDSFDKILRLFLQEEVPILPVYEGESLMGVVRQSDVLRSMNRGSTPGVRL